jgi:hypothetical protein
MGICRGLQYSASVQRSLASPSTNWHGSAVLTWFDCVAGVWRTSTRTEATAKSLQWIIFRELTWTEKLFVSECDGSWILYTCRYNLNWKMFPWFDCCAVGDLAEQGYQLATTFSAGKTPHDNLSKRRSAGGPRYDSFRTPSSPVRAHLHMEITPSEYASKFEDFGSFLQEAFQ